MSDRLASSPEAVVRRVVHVQRPRHTGRRRRTARVALGVLVVLAIIGLVLGLQYRRQITSYLTHWKGSPTNTRPLVAFPSSDRSSSTSRWPATPATAAAASTDPRTRSLHRNSTDPFDVLLLLGDNVYPNGDPAKLDATVFTRSRPCSTGYASCSRSSATTT